jgi:uncharacterized protein (DUF488 family)
MGAFSTFPEPPMSEATAERRLFSIGHSNHPLETFLALLRRHRIEVLVDARSHPYSRFASHFDTGSLKKAVVEAGMKYLFLGKELGGRPEGDEFYDAQGHVLYSRVAESPEFLEGIRRLETGVTRYRVALLCSEENPSGCHRRLLVGRVLAAHGIMLDHIRGDGRVQTESELEAEEEQRRTRGQTALFEEREEEEEWRSIQSVLQRGLRKDSSGR